MHFHLYHANMYGRVAAFFAGISSVTTEHNIYLQNHKMHRGIVSEKHYHNRDRQDNGIA